MSQFHECVANLTARLMNLLGVSNVSAPSASIRIRVRMFIGRCLQIKIGSPSWHLPKRHN